MGGPINAATGDSEGGVLEVLHVCWRGVMEPNGCGVKEEGSSEDKMRIIFDMCDKDDKGRVVIGFF